MQKTINGANGNVCVAKIENLEEIMGKTYSFSNGYTVEVGTEKMVVTSSYGDFAVDFSDLRSVLYVKPKFIFSGFINVKENYINLKRKDIPLAEELLAQLESLGVFVQRSRGICTETYIESSIMGGGYLPTYWIKDGALYCVDDANHAQKVDISQIKSICIDNKYISFQTTDTNMYTGKDLVKVVFDEEGEEELFILFNKKYRDAVIKFANNVASLGENINVYVM